MLAESRCIRAWNNANTKINASVESLMTHESMAIDAVKHFWENLVKMPTGMKVTINKQPTLKGYDVKRDRNMNVIKQTPSDQS